MAIKIKNTPLPNVLMNSMRSIGYNFKTAIADIIDNSISANANNIYIFSPVNDEKIFITILDDGEGMDDCELFNAMKYGSNKEFYGTYDLGRFGLGLKSASLSQCRILTVVSKKNNSIAAYQWNLDSVIENREWDCLKLEEQEIKILPNISDLQEQTQGTLVIWENFDIGYKKSGGRIRDYLCDEIAEAESHIRLVFHRFMSNNFKPLRIYINQSLLEPIDPFLEYHRKTDTQNPKEIDVNGSIVKIQPFILPHQTDLTNDDIEKLGGIESLRNGQGFYIYRNERLIIFGTWFRLSASNINNELYKYGRIKVDIPNTLDDMWEIDIKKQNATIPKQMLNNLKKAVSSVCIRSKEKNSKRARLTLEKDDSKIWNKTLSRDNKDLFFVNENSEFIKRFLDEFGDKDKIKILHFIDVISSSLPYDDIYNSICNKNNETKLDDKYIESIVLEGASQFKTLKQLTQLSDEKVLELVCKYEPFNNELISLKIKGIVNNEKQK